MRTSHEIDSSNWPEIWQAAYRLLEKSIAESQLKTWIRPLTVRRSEDEGDFFSFELGADNDFSADWVGRHHKDAIEMALSQVTGKSCKIKILACPEQRPKFDQNTPPSGQNQNDAQSAPTAFPAPTQTFQNTGVVLKAGVSPSQIVMTNPRDGDGRETIDARFTFDNYVVGASNQFAHASAIAVAEKPAHQYNPLFIYSPPGLGKTHLLYAIANQILASDPNKRVVYLSGENFVNELIESISQNRMSYFRNKYRNSFDVLLIDDIQFIAAKKQTEEEFFHTFNALYSAKRQIILASDRPPKEIEKLEERIRTRFEWGLVADIQPPEIETRIAILKSKAERDDIYLPDDVATFLATYIRSSVRELEGVLITLQAQASLTGSEISLEMAKKILKTAVPAEGAQHTVETIQAVVAKHFQLKVQDLKSTSRANSVAIPRHIAIFLTRKYTGLGFKEIGRYFGGRDHSTILHACNKIEKECETQTSIHKQVEEIQNQL